MVDKDLQKARQLWFLQEINSMQGDNIQAEIAQKTGYKKQTVNTYINDYRSISLDFMRTFCEAYDYNFDQINLHIIEQVKKQIEEENKLPQNKDVPTPTSGKKSVVNYNTPLIKTQGFVTMNDFMKFYEEEQRQKAQLLAQQGMLIHQQGELIKKIPDSSEDRETGKKRRAS